MSNKDRTDHMANERTFLAWIRTSIGIMALGFVVEKFNLFVKQFSQVISPFGRGVPSSPFANYAGIVLIIFGVFITVFAYLRFRIVARQIINDSYKPYFLLDLILTLFVLTAGIVMAAFMVGEKSNKELNQIYFLISSINFIFSSIRGSAICFSKSYKST